MRSAEIIKPMRRSPGLYVSVIKVVRSAHERARLEEAGTIIVEVSVSRQRRRDAEELMDPRERSVVDRAAWVELEGEREALHL